MLLLFYVMPAAGQQDTAAVRALVERWMPEHSGRFRFEIVPSDKDGFEITDSKGQILIRGNNGVSLASALHWYLRNKVGCQVSADTKKLALPHRLPDVNGNVSVSTPFRYRYLFNYCTYGYTMPWWDWERWERMIDFMAMNGVNMPLAIIGQEVVWQEVLRDAGLSASEIAAFFTGPAHLPWGWMGNIDGVGGPLPAGWFEKRRSLQEKILQRMRSFGMTPVLQGFTGHVPESMKKYYPKARITRIQDWAGIKGTWFLDPSDSLFARLAASFIRHQTALFGTDHLYDADCFIEVDPPSGDTAFLRRLGSQVYAAMREADPQAVWVMQGWFFYFRREFWTPERGRAFLQGVPENRLIALDLYGEKNPVWDKTDAFYGQPWIWNVICNEDQKVNMSGDLNTIQRNFLHAFKQEGGKKMAGIGIIPEGLGYNAVVWDFLLDKVWDQDSTDLRRWIAAYASRRYGAANTAASQAWQLLLGSVYSRTRTFWSPLLTTPGLKIFSGGSADDIRHLRLEYNITENDPYGWDFDVPKLAEAADKLLQCAPALYANDAYRFDLVNVWRELLHSLTHRFLHDMSSAYSAKDVGRFNSASAALLKLLDDMDAITGTHPDFMLGSWLKDASSWGDTPEEKRYYERDARTIVTIWQPWKNGGLRDYAGKQWNGLLKGYYKPRWELLVRHLGRSLRTAQPFDPERYDREVRELDYNWTLSNEPYPSAPVADTRKVIERLKLEYTKYFKFK